MKDVILWILTAVTALLLIVAIVVGLNFLGLTTYKFFAPKWENARRDVFENTRSYQRGKELEQRKLEREKDRESQQIIENLQDHLRP